MKKSPFRWLLIGAAALLLLVTCNRVLSPSKHDSSSSKSSSSTVASTPAPTKSTGCGKSGPTCDATPKVDGRYRVAGDGFLDTGISPGWIGTQGRRPDAAVCLWKRLSGPIVTEINMMIAVGRVESVNDPTYVQIEKGDAYFWSEGCQPWVRIDR